MGQTTINMLGDSERERWINALGLYASVIRSNIASVLSDARQIHQHLEIISEDGVSTFTRSDLKDLDACARDQIGCADAADKTIVQMLDEMHRFIDGAYEALGAADEPDHVPTPAELKEASEKAVKLTDGGDGGGHEREMVPKPKPAR